MTKESTIFYEIATNLWDKFSPGTQEFLLDLTNRTVMLLHEDEDADVAVGKEVGEPEEYVIIQAEEAQFIDILERRRDPCSYGLTTFYRYQIASQGVFKFLIDRVREDNQSQS